MKLFRIAPIVFSFAALAAVPAQAAAVCDLKIIDGVVGGICELRAFFEGITTVIDLRKRPSLRANLQVDGIDSLLNQGNIELSVDIENLGLGAAQAHDIHIVVVEQPTGSAVVNHPFVVRATGGIPRGTSRGFFVGVVPLHNPDDNTDLTVVVNVDSPTAARPTGEVAETNENDNMRTFECTVYGETNPTPATFRVCN